MRSPQQTTQNHETGSTDATGSGQESAARPDQFELQLIDAFQRELSDSRTRIYQLETRLSRYDRVFDSMFREELDRRVGSKSALMGMDVNAACEISPLERLKYEAGKLAQSGRL